MKILQISSLYPPTIIGGAEQSAKVISEALAALGHELHVVTLQEPGKDFTGSDSASPVTVHRVPLANLYWPWDGAGKTRSASAKAIWHGFDTSNEVMVRRVVSIVQRVQPDIVLTHNVQGFSTAIMPAIKRLNVPLVHVIRDYALLCAQTSLYRNGRACGVCDKRCTPCRMLTAPRHRHVEAADAVVSVSQSVFDLHRAHGLFSDTPHKVIYNALRPAITIQDSIPDRPRGHVFTFGFLGRVEHSKGVETMLRAARKLELAGVEFKLLVAGRAEADYLKFLRQTYPLDSVEYRGFVDAASFLRELDTLIFPSEWVEALGNGVFVAFAQGVPVIGSDVGGIPETIDDGVTGLVFEAADAEQLGAYMMELASRPHVAEAMARAALKKSQQYLAARRADEYISYLDQVLQGTAAGAAA